MNDDSSILQYLKRKRWDYKFESDQYKIKQCPYCGDTRFHFYINRVTGQFRCVKCDSVGNMFSLKKYVGDISSVKEVFSERPLSDKRRRKYNRRSLKYHFALVGNLDVRRYLYNKWGYTLKDIRTFRLGILRDKNDVAWLSIPYFNEDNQLVNIKFRTILSDTKDFSRVANMESSLFNVQNLNTNSNYIYVIEGESDTITAHTKLRLNVVGVTVGARGFKSEWKDIIEQFEIINVLYDPDVDGQIGAQKLAERIGLHRCFNILLPTTTKDLTEWWKVHRSRSKFREIEEKRKRFSVKDIIPINDVLTQLKSNMLHDNVLDSGFQTPWESINKLIGNMVPGDLIILSGQAKVGKSTFALNILLYQSLMMLVPSLYYCLEMRPERIVTKIISFLRFVQRNEITTDDLDVVHGLFGRKPFYLGHSYTFTPEIVVETIRASVQRYGIEFLVFDHLHYLIRSLSNVAAEVSNMVRQFKLLAEELKIPIILIAQPKKLTGKRSRMTIHDLRDSSSIGQDGDTIIILHRDRLDVGLKRRNKKIIFSNNSEIIVEATRYNPGGVAELVFDGALSRYFNNKREQRKLLSLRNRRSSKTFVF